jgi:murein tripeptide amidase MpaA
MPDLPAVQYDHYYGHAELSAHLRALLAARPEHVRLHNLYTTQEGREEWLVEVTDCAAGGPEEKPGYLVHANVHAPEVSGTTAALRLIERLLTEREFGDVLAEMACYVIPRANPDGAEYALTTSGPIRSKFQVRPCKNGLVPQDLNGDGLILHMRWEDPFGPYAADEADPRILRAREPEDEGPFYQMATEGVLLDYDGGPIESAVRGFDFNRNWGSNWKPEHLQWGAGDYAFSQPEMKAVADWVYSHPGIFGMLGFHNGCNAVLRPSATVADEELRPADLKAMRQLCAEGSVLTRFPPLAVRMYKSDSAAPISLKGHFTDWGYFGLGLFVFEIELGNSYNAAGITTEEFFAADDQTRDVEYRRRVMRLMDEHPEWDAFVDWRPCRHPQLGEVEIGGLKTIPYCCPPSAALEQTTSNCADFIISHARHRPKLALNAARAEHIAGGVYRLTATVGNTGLLPTHITEQALGLAHQPPVTVRVLPGEGVRVVSRGALVEIEGLAALTGCRDLEWFVHRAVSEGTVEILAQHPKAGVARTQVILA